MNLCCLKLNRAYSISPLIRQMIWAPDDGKFFWSWILKDCIQVQEKKKKVVVFCSRPRQNVKLGSFTLLSCNEGRECTKNGDARAKLFFCLSKPFAFLPFSLPSPSSLRKLPINSNIPQWSRATGDEAVNQIPVNYLKSCFVQCTVGCIQGA